jgi:hypothetical protein
LAVLAVDKFSVLRDTESANDPIGLSNIVEKEPGLAKISLLSEMRGRDP